MLEQNEQIPNWTLAKTVLSYNHYMMTHDKAIAKNTFKKL